MHFLNFVLHPFRRCLQGRFKNEPPLLRIHLAKFFGTIFKSKFAVLKIAAHLAQFFGTIFKSKFTMEGAGELYLNSEAIWFENWASSHRWILEITTSSFWTQSYLLCLASSFYQYYQSRYIHGRRVSLTGFFSGYCLSLPCVNIIKFQFFCGWGGVTNFSRRCIVICLIRIQFLGGFGGLPTLTGRFASASAPVFTHY